MSTTRSVFLLNVHSRKIRRNPQIADELEHLYGGRGRFIRSRDPAELPQIVGEIRKDAPDYFLICGGDGTLRQTLATLTQMYEEQALPDIVILPGGTMNTVATSLGIYRPPRPHLKMFLDRLDRSTPLFRSKRSMLRVNESLGFIFGVGGFSRFIEIYNQSRDPTPFKGAKLISETLFSSLLGGPLALSMFSKFRVNLWRDGDQLLKDEEVTNVSAASIRHIGFHFKPFVGAEKENGTFGLLVFRDTPRRLLFSLPRLFVGKPIKERTILQSPAHEVVVQLETPMRPMLDGDILSAQSEFRLTRGPTLRFVRI